MVYIPTDVKMMNVIAIEEYKIIEGVDIIIDGGDGEDIALFTDESNNLCIRIYCIGTSILLFFAKFIVRIGRYYKSKSTYISIF